MPSHRFQWNLARLKGIPNNWKSQNGLTTAIFRGELHHPLLFSHKILQILHKIRVKVRSSKTWAIHPIPMWLHMSVKFTLMSLVSYMQEYHVVWLITCQSMEVNSYPCKMGAQTMVILRPNISSDQVPPKETAISHFSSTFGPYESLKKNWDLLFFVRRLSSNPAHLAEDFSLMTNIIKVPLYTAPTDKS